MTVPFACVVIAIVLVYLSKLPVAVAQWRRPEGYDNRNPREQQAKLEGAARRALAAHQNGFESFPAFAAAVIIAHVGGGDPRWASILAVTFVAARAAYPFIYVAGLGTLRSIVWTVGFTATMGLFLLPAMR
jgi:uncharacterized MAPEG superfamily protein